MVTRCSVREPDPFAGSIHEQEAREPVDLVGEDHELDRLLLEVATVPRPADTAPLVAGELARLRTRDDAIEAGRVLLTRLLREERHRPRLIGRLLSETHEAMQALRDCCAAERRARRSR